MKIIPLLIKEFENEAKTTRKFLDLVPEEKFDWKPHEKSMSLKRLSVHIAELASWPDMVIKTEGLDFAESDYKPTPVENAEELKDLLEESYEKGLKAFQSTDEQILNKTWTMRNGKQVISENTKYEMIRHSFSQTIHHRAQLGVYLRLLDIPIPGSYGPSADDQQFA